MSEILRIANAQGFWGDSPGAASQLVRLAPDLDYLTLDYLAEVSMSILAKQRERDPSAGYARDFLDVVRSLVPIYKAGRKLRMITNAGGLNPQACATAVARVLRENGVGGMKIGIVSGDDVLPHLRQDANTSQFAHLESGERLSKIADCLVTANAYLGAAPVVEALVRGADIIITGRLADPSLTVAPCIANFKWPQNDWDRIAGATVAGHLIECGTQVTGGISTDWREISLDHDIGFPIAEVSSDGSCVITKPPGTAGRVDERSVKEQLVYEIGDPGNYLSPDVTASLLKLRVEKAGHDRMRVSGAQGRPASNQYKVSATYRAGFRASGILTIFGRDAVIKARRCGEMVLRRLRESGGEPERSRVECLGAGDVSAGIIPALTGQLESVLRITVADRRREVVERFTREIMPLVTAGPQGTTGYGEGRPAVREVFGYWPTLIDKELVQPVVELLEREVAMPIIRLGEIAYARSGDKGAGANIGVIARTAAAYDWLRDRLSADRVEDYFKPMGVGDVTRFDWPALGALNFVLPGILDGGGSLSLRIDAQGKALGQILLEMKLEISEPELASLKQPEAKT